MPAPRDHSRAAGFVLVTLIFLVLAGVLLLAAMAYLYGTSSTGQGAQNVGAQAFISAESGDQYGVYWLETRHGTAKTVLTKGGPWYPVPPLDNAACPALVKITYTGKSGATYDYQVVSTTTCPSSSAYSLVDRTVQGTKTKGLVTYKMTAWAER